MPIYQFFLGSHPPVSLAELKAKRLIRPLQQHRCLEHGSKTFVFTELSDAYVLSNKLDILGGIPKVAQLIKKIEHVRFDKIVEIINNYLLLNYFSKSSKSGAIPKLLLTVNLYKQGNTNMDVQNIRILLKKSLKDKGISVKILGNYKREVVPPATTFHLLKRAGLEFNITVMGSNIVTISRTIWVQNIEFWEYVDSKRPVRDMKLGILPSKLARIMLNLAGLRRNMGFWDPFVGTGTTLMQGQFLKVYSYGSDISVDSLQKAEQNIQWLHRSGLVDGLRYRLFSFDVRKNPKTNKLLRSIIRHGRFDAIVTEGYLGQGRTKPFPSLGHAVHQWRQIRHLYHALLKVQLPALRVGGRFVFTIPVYKYMKTNKKLGLFVPKLKYNKNRLKIPDIIASSTLLWISKKSYVGRNIIVLERIK